MLLLLLVGLIPFAIIGILLGHLKKVDSLGPALSGITSLFALAGSSFGPLFQTGVMVKVVTNIPSYWLVQASQSVSSKGGWPPTQAWVVMARVATRAYRCDSQRVL
jgi:ABC-2 type transport system permease protein